MLNIICWKWKPKGAYRSSFGPETVNILKQMVKRHFHKPHRFICVTDDPIGIDPDVKIIPLWEEHGNIVNPHGATNPSCYRRLKLFSPDAAKLFGHRYVSLDLDCVIVKDVTPLWDRSEDIVLWGDTNPGTYYNGSMLLMTAGCRPDVWTDFNPNTSPSISKANGQFGSDQGWISYKLGPGEKKWTIDDGVVSYRIHVRNIRNKVLPPSARIVMFHGATDPWDDQASGLPWVKDNWRYDTSIKTGIEAINMEKGIALLSNGKYVKIVMLFDINGNETDNIYRAVSFVAGYGEHFWSDLFSHFRIIGRRN